MKKRLLFFVMLPLAACIIGACSDELEGSKLYDDGFLHFNLLFNNSSANRWAEDDKAAGTRCEEPIELTSPDMPGLKLYLHTVVSDEIETPTPVAENSDKNVTTRGQRITGEVFNKGDDPDKQIITTLGIWGKVGSDEALCESTKSFKAFNLADGTWSEESGWQVKQGEQELEIATWPDGATGTFYGVAPYPGNETNQAPGIEATVDNNLVPTLTYNMPYYEANHKDVLAARAEVTKNNGAKDIKLEFSHILSAVKFGGTDISGGISCEVKVNPNDNTETADTYTLTVTKIQVTGVRKSGTYNFDSGQWTTINNSDNIGRCEINALPADHAEHSSTNDPNQTYYDINGDEQCLMMLPQDLPSDANVIFLCTVKDNTGTTIKEDLIIKAPITTTTGTWEPGHTYTYTLSDTKGKYELFADMSNLTNTFSVDGTKTVGGEIVADEQTFTIQSRFHDELDDTDHPANGGTPVQWKIQYALLDPNTNQYSGYKDGLPSSFYLKGPDGKLITDLDQGTLINGSESPKTYTLGATTRFKDEFDPSKILKSVEDLRKNGETYNYNDYDLSLHAIDGKNTTINRSTANCYIVRGYGTFKFPLVYGNAIKDGQQNPASYTERTEPSGEKYMIFTNYLGKHITKGDIFEDTGVALTDCEPCIVWMDERNLIMNNLTIAHDNTTGYNYLKFEIKKEYVKSGSAILGIKDGGGNIMWSWHIWVTPEDLLSDQLPDNSANPNKPVKVSEPDGTAAHDMYFMTQNLGWRTPEEIKFDDPLTFKMKIVQIVNGVPKNEIEQEVQQSDGKITISGSNLYYQFGRKDPMPGNYLDKDGNEKSMVDNIKANGYSWGTGAPDYMKEAIKNPNILLAESEGDWMQPRFTKHYAGRWDPLKADDLADVTAYKNTKTIYDPSPVGFQVPPRAAYNVLKKWGDSNKHTVLDNGLRGILFNDQLTFYETGWRVHGTGAVEHFGYRTSTKSKQGHGYHWTAGVNTATTGLNSHFGIFMDTHNNDANNNITTINYERAYCRNHTMAVRAIKEKENGLENVDAELSTSEFNLYYDANYVSNPGYAFNKYDEGEAKHIYYAITVGESKLKINYTIGTGSSPRFNLYASSGNTTDANKQFYIAPSDELTQGEHTVEIPITNDRYNMLTTHLASYHNLLKIDASQVTIHSIKFIP